MIFLFVIDVDGRRAFDFVCSCVLAGVTWGKVVSLYAVAGGLAVDCVRHGNPAMVHTIVDCMGEFVRKSLASWLRKRGGWVRGGFIVMTLVILCYKKLVLISFVHDL